MARNKSKRRVFQSKVFIPDDHIQLISKYFRGANLNMNFELSDVDNSEGSRSKRNQRSTGDNGRRQKKRRSRSRKKRKSKRCKCCKCQEKEEVEIVRCCGPTVECSSMAKNKACRRLFEPCFKTTSLEKRICVGQKYPCALPSSSCGTKETKTSMEPAGCLGSCDHSLYAKNCCCDKPPEPEKACGCCCTTQLPVNGQNVVSEGHPSKPEKAQSKPALGDHQHTSCCCKCKNNCQSKEAEGEGKIRKGKKVNSKNVTAQPVVPDFSSRSTNDSNSESSSFSPKEMTQVYTAKNVSSLENDELYRRYWYHRPPLENTITHCDENADHPPSRVGLHPTSTNIRNDDTRRCNCDDIRSCDCEHCPGSEIAQHSVPLDRTKNSTSRCLACKEPMCFLCKLNVCECDCDKPNFVICNPCEHKLTPKPQKTPRTKRMQFQQRPTNASSDEVINWVTFLASMQAALRGNECCSQSCDC